MKIVLDNVSDGDAISHRLLLVRGRVENLDSSVLDDDNDLQKQDDPLDLLRSPILSPSSGPKRLLVTSKTEANSRYSLVESIKLGPGGKFKLIIRLKPGANWFSFEFCRIVKHLFVSCSAKIAQAEQSHKIKLIYIVNADNPNGEFQAPDGVQNDLSSAIRRISTAGSLIQCFMSDSLDAHGLGRKTIQFAQNYDDEDQNQSILDEAMPSVFVFKSSLTKSESHKMGQNELWNFHAKELIQAYQNHDDLNCIKYLAITSATTYENPKQIKFIDHEQVVKMTKSHVALGGGGLALIGSGCLYSWPEKFQDVQSTLLDKTKIDTNLVMDDSAYRGTIGGCFATTLGAAIHELGHTLDLGHSEAGIMARGFDDLDKFFTASRNEQTATAAILQSGLKFCGATRKVAPKKPEEIPGKSTVNESGASQQDPTSFLEQYQKRKYYRKMVQDCGGAYWSRSCALILSCNKWLNRDQVLEESAIEFDHRTNSVLGLNEDGICVVEIRDENGTVLHYEEPEFSEATGRKLHRIQRPDLLVDQNVLFATDFAGNTLKIDVLPIEF